MTLRIDGTDVGAIVEGAAWAGSILGILIMALLIYLVVRPPRRPREAKPAVEAVEEIDGEEMLALMERMERRLEVLERAVDAEPKHEPRILEAGEAPEHRRNQ
jgi:hypothetical protein